MAKRRGRPPRIRRVQDLDEAEKLFDEPTPERDQWVGEESQRADDPLAPPSNGQEAARKAWVTRRERKRAESVTASPTAPAPEFDPAVVDVFYQAVSGVLVAVLTRAGFSARASAAVALTPEDLASLRGPTSAMLTKYVPMAAYGVEWAFGLSVLGVMMAKVMLFQAAIREEQSEAA